MTTNEKAHNAMPERHPCLPMPPSFLLFSLFEPCIDASRRIANYQTPQSPSVVRSGSFIQAQLSASSYHSSYRMRPRSHRHHNGHSDSEHLIRRNFPPPLLSRTSNLWLQYRILPHHPPTERPLHLRSQRQFRNLLALSVTHHIALLVQSRILHALERAGPGLDVGGFGVRGGAESGG